MKTTVFITFIFLSQIIYAQEKLLLFRYDQKKTELRNFYIADVIDGRENQDNIGFSRVGLFNKKVPTDLKGGVQQAVGLFLKNSFSKDTGKTPIVVKIVHLEISERPTFSTEIGRAEIKIEFYKSENGKLGKVYESEAFIEEPGFDVTNGHEKRIREVVTSCIERFNNTNWDSIIPDYAEKEVIVTKKENASTTSFSKIDKEALRWKNIITLNRTLGINANGFGFTYYGYSNEKEKAWIFPMVLSANVFTIKSEYFNQFNYKTANINYWSPGVLAMKSIKNNFFICLGLAIPIGYETLKNYSEGEVNHSFLGLGASQGLYYIPKSRVGITVGIGIYEKVLTSKVFKSDVGLKVELGLKF